MVAAKLVKNRPKMRIFLIFGHLALKSQKGVKMTKNFCRPLLKILFSIFLTFIKKGVIGLRLVV